MRGLSYEWTVGVAVGTPRGHTWMMLARIFRKTAPFAAWLVAVSVLLDLYGVEVAEREAAASELGARQEEPREAEEDVRPLRLPRSTALTIGKRGEPAVLEMELRAQLTLRPSGLEVAFRPLSQAFVHKLAPGTVRVERLGIGLG